MFKLGHLVDGVWQEHSHQAVFTIEHFANGQRKVLTTAPRSEPSVFRAIVDLLTPPFFVLYVLHTPRGEGDPGRYQSELMSAEEFREFLDRFGDLLSSDSRFDLWVRSPADEATVIWDRHNLIHAYGPADLVIETLGEMGFQPGEPDIPAAHQHYYHRELDEQAAALLDSRDWRYSPLQPDDEQ